MCRTRKNNGELTSEVNVISQNSKFTEQYYIIFLDGQFCYVIEPLFPSFQNVRPLD